MRRQPTDAHGHLVWLFVQGFLFMPNVVGAFWSNEPVWHPGLILNVALTVWLTFAIARNLIRLWRLRDALWTRGILAGLGLVSVVFALLSARFFYAGTNPVVAVDEGKHIPLAVAFASLAAALLVLEIRTIARAMSRRSRSSERIPTRQP